MISVMLIMNKNKFFPNLFVKYLNDLGTIIKRSSGIAKFIKIMRNESKIVYIK